MRLDKRMQHLDSVFAKSRRPVHQRARAAALAGPVLALTGSAKRSYSSDPVTLTIT